VPKKVIIETQQKPQASKPELVQQNSIHNSGKKSVSQISTNLKKYQDENIDPAQDSVLDIGLLMDGGISKPNRQAKKISSATKIQKEKVE